jgi:hypothetical protein
MDSCTFVFDKVLRFNPFLPRRTICLKKEGDSWFFPFRERETYGKDLRWIPAFAGMTRGGTPRNERWAAPRVRELTVINPQIYLARADAFFAVMRFRVDAGAAEVKGRPFMAVGALQES